MHIFLVGFMGAGKTYLGCELAKQLGFDFVDLDKVIEESTHLPIAEFFQEHGEPAFRQMEAVCLRKLPATPTLVVSTGGGAPCFHQNMDWMNENGITIYLSASPMLLAERLLIEKSQRPLIAVVPDGKLEGFIEQVLGERSAFYEKCHIKFAVPQLGLAGLGDLANYLKRFISNK
jgi:shikimate kinase